MCVIYVNVLIKLSYSAGTSLSLCRSNPRLPEPRSLSTIHLDGSSLLQALSNSLTLYSEVTGTNKPNDNENLPF
jgi:hypothetical protein